MAHLGKGHSEACCSIPPVSAEYKEKGEFTKVNGTKLYKTGPADADTAIFIVYDIFGYSPQALQGADILAFADKTKKYQVFMPDLLNSTFADLAWFPPDTDEKSKKLGDFFSGPANPKDNVPKVASLAQELTKQSNGTITKWAIIGFCWGGKITTLSIASNDLFSAAGSCHPAMVDPNDAPSVKIPFIMLPSKDEDASAVEAFQKKLTVSNEVETFRDQVHGWMGARADLEDKRVNEEYQRGYSLLLEFFHKHLATSAKL